MAAKSKSASRKPAASAKKSPAKKSKPAAVKKAVKKTARKAVGKAIQKTAAKKIVKAVLKKSARKPAKPSKELQMQVVEFVRTNPSHEILHAAVEKFEISYDHLKDWLKKEGGQVAEAVEHLIAAQKSTVLKKGEEKLGQLAKAVEAKKKDLEKLAARFKKSRKK